jgi:zinicin-like metallopeptidase
LKFADFRTMVEHLAQDVPREFRDGIVAIDVSPKAVPDPVRGGVYTLGECIPLEWSGNGANLQSRIVLYHGSFAAVARSHAGASEWRQEAWDTLAHELRHHLEWRADVDALEAYDWAAEQNFARGEGQAFDPVFYRSGERLAEGVYKVDDDVFIEKNYRDGGRGRGDEVVWHGRHYRVPMPAGTQPPLFLSLEGLLPLPAGDVIVVVPARPSLLNLWRRHGVTSQAVAVEPIDA